MINFHFHAPLAAGGADLFALENSLVTDYQHEITATEGFRSATMTVGASEPAIEDWLEYGLERHLEVLAEDRQTVWEGMVNSITARVGRAAITHGPLLDISNYVYATYTPLDTSVSPPVRGTQTRTLAAQNVDSRARYGTFEQIVQAGEATAADADYALDLFLAEQAWPAYSTEWAEPSAPSLSLELVGYWAMLERVHYLETTVGTVVVSDPATPPYGKLQQVLSDAIGVNSWQASTDNSNQSANAALAPNYDDDSKTAWTVIQELVSLGDAANNRWLFGLYGGRKAYYAVAPTAPEYFVRLRGNVLSVEDANGNSVKPWLVRPGKWLEYSDLFPGRGAQTLSQRDPRREFIESVSYQMPFGLSLPGGRVHRLDQMLAQMGLGVR